MHVPSHSSRRLLPLPIRLISAALDRRTVKCTHAARVTATEDADAAHLGEQVLRVETAVVSAVAIATDRLGLHSK